MLDPTPHTPLPYSTPAPLLDLRSDPLPPPQQSGLAPDMMDSIISLLVQDNLDLGCSVIERAATDKAMRDVDKLLQLVSRQTMGGLEMAQGEKAVVADRGRRDGMCGK